MAEQSREPADLDTRRVLVGAISILAMVVIAMAVAWIFIVHLSQPGRVATRNQRARFPQPAEQPVPLEDLAQYRKEQQARLTQYRWIDRKAGVVQIPVDRAIDALARERGSAPGGGPASGGAPPGGAQ